MSDEETTYPEVETYAMGEVVVSVWDAGWQRQPWSGAEVHGARVELTWGVYEYGPVMFYDSIANADAGESVNLREAAGTVADELASFAADPDEFIRMILEDVDADNFDEKREAIDKLRGSESIGVYLLTLSDGDGEWFEKWATT